MIRVSVVASVRIVSVSVVVSPRISLSFGFGLRCGFRLGTTFSDEVTVGVSGVGIVGRIVIGVSEVIPGVGISLGVRLGQALGGREGHSQKSGEHNQLHGDKSFWSSKRD